MAFAIFYEHGDLAPIVANVQAAGLGSYSQFLTNSERQLAQRAWNGGLKDWATAPIAQAPCEQPDPNTTTRRVVVTAQNVTLAEFRALLYKVAASAGATAEMQYLRALADDMGGCAGAVEPWP